jgi:hypothetical protein
MSFTAQMGQMGRTHRMRGEGKATENQLDGAIAPPNKQRQLMDKGINRYRVMCTAK